MRRTDRRRLLSRSRLVNRARTLEQQSSSGPLRIVHVSPGYAPLVGGVERLLQAVSERLAQRGHDVTVLTFSAATAHDFSLVGGADLPSTEMLNGVRVIRVDPSGGTLKRIHEWSLRRRGGWRLSRRLFGEDMWPLWLPS